MRQRRSTHGAARTAQHTRCCAAAYRPPHAHTTQDRSEKRRGVPCAHLKFGEPTAINAASAAYFACQLVLQQPSLAPERRLRLYDFYFGCLRAGHAGQALDIAGLGYLVSSFLATPEGSPEAAAAARAAEAAVIAVHRLKTGVPAASLVRMGALVGGGSDAAIEGAGLYFESIGIAFQVRGGRGWGGVVRGVLMLGGRACQGFCGASHGL